jgi:polyhydroxyalkanoate synthesis repressor PhaR
VNLDYVKKLILEHDDFEIVDSKTGDDVTKSMLLQIISESETNENQSLLTNSLLKQLIRFYGGDMNVLVRQYLEQSLSNFLDQQDAMQGMMKNLTEANPLNLFGKMMEQNMGAWTGSNKKSGDDKAE